MNTKPLNIWMLQISETLPLTEKIRKTRTALLCDELAARGHSIVWWASAFDHAEKKWIAQDDEVRQLAPGVKVHFLTGCGYTKNISVKRLWDHRLVARKFAARAQAQPRPDIIVASMPSYDFAYYAARLAQKWGIPYIIDIRDQWPDSFFNRRPFPLRQIARTLLAYDSYMLNYQVRHADSVLSMMDGLLQWGLKKAGRPQTSQDKVFYIGAAKPPKPEYPNIFNLPSDKFVVAFIGTFGTHSSPTVLLRAAQRLKDRKDILIVLGGGGENYDNLVSQAKGLQNLRFTGWLNSEQIYSLLNHSHAGVVAGAPGVAAFPNKSFVYFSMGLPVISNAEGELRQFLEKNSTGLYFSNDSDADLAEQIVKLKDNPELHKTMRENSRRAFEQHFDAKKLYADYADHVEEIAAEREKNH